METTISILIEFTIAARDTALARVAMPARPPPPNIPSSLFRHLRRLELRAQQFTVIEMPNSIRDLGSAPHESRVPDHEPSPRLRAAAAFDGSPPPLNAKQRACCGALGLALREGYVFAALTGPAGSGKTLVLETVLADLRDGSLRCIRIAEPDKVPAQLASHIEQVAYAEASKSENAGRHVVLAVDDAHLASDELLHCLTRIAGMREPGRRIPQLLVVGRPEVWSRLAAEKFEPLSRRIAIRAVLPYPEPNDPWSTIEEELTRRGVPDLPAATGEPRTAFDRAPSVPPRAPEQARIGRQEDEVPGHSLYDSLFPEMSPGAAPPRPAQRRLLFPATAVLVTMVASAFALSWYWP